MLELLRTPYTVSVLLLGTGIVRLERTPEPIRSGHVMRGDLDRQATRLKELDRARYGLLLDLRNAPPNDSSEIEAASIRGLRRVVEGFARVAVIIRTSTGRLQVGRLSSANGAGVSIFDQESEAMAFLADRPR
jgi:hypothetical protein